MIHCSTCNKPAPHFTHIDGVALVCDACVTAGELSCLKIFAPEQPGVTQPSLTVRIPLVL